MNRIIDKINTEIQFAVENNMNHATIIVDSIPNDKLMEILSNISNDYTGVRTTRYDDKIHIHVYWMFKNMKG